jgi:hypothetical protein
MVMPRCAAVSCISRNSACFDFVVLEKTSQVFHNVGKKQSVGISSEVVATYPIALLPTKLHGPWTTSTLGAVASPLKNALLSWERTGVGV